MSTQQPARLSRRVFVARVTASGAALGALSVLGCGGSEPEALTCTGAVDATALATRSALHYVDAATDPSKTCLACALYQGNAAACGTCGAVPGPIHPQGTCDAFAPKPA